VGSGACLHARTEPGKAEEVAELRRSLEHARDGWRWELNEAPWWAEEVEEGFVDFGVPGANKEEGELQERVGKLKE
jgi:hypothetical protein